MNHLAHSFGHAAVRGAGYSAGRHIEHALYHAVGVWGLVAIVVIALLLGRGWR